MGNDLMKGYKDNYIQGNFKIIKKFNNDLFGTYYLIYILKPKSQYFYLKTIDPNKFNNFSCDIDLFIEKIKNQHKNLNNFVFLTTNKYNEENFDWVFEYSPTLFDLLILQKKEIFKTEKEIWLLVEDVLEGFIFMEEKKEHLIEINLNTLSLKDGKDFTIMNPYLFENYFNEVLGIYLNKNLENILYNRKNINKNLIEFGSLIIKLVSKDYKIEIDLDNGLMNLEKIKHKISKKLHDLIFIIFNKDQKLLFSDIKNFLIKGSKKGDIFEKILSNNKDSSTKYKHHQKIFDEKKDNSKQKNSSSNKYSSDSKNSEKNIFNKKIDSNKNIMKNNFKEENNNIEVKNFNTTRKLIKTKSNEYISEENNILEKNYQSNVVFKFSKPTSLRNVQIDINNDKNKKDEKKNNLGFPENKDKPSLINYNKNSLPNNRFDSLPNKLNKNVNINLISPEGNFNKLYNIDDNYDNDKNNFFYQNIKKIINWNSNLRESVYHKDKKLLIKNSFQID